MVVEVVLLLVAEEQQQEGRSPYDVCLDILVCSIFIAMMMTMVMILVILSIKEYNKQYIICGAAMAYLYRVS